MASLASSTTNSEAIRVIGTFHPSEFVKETIEREIKPLLPACCQCERVGVRVPDPRAAAPHPDNLEWHQDGMPAYHMVVWASEMPTEFRLPDGTEWHAEPFDLVWFDNTVVYHRQPRGTNEQQRWFLAVRCSGVTF